MKPFQLDDIFISDFDFIGDKIPIAIPSKLSNDYKHKIIAAYKTVAFGYKSVDRTYEKLKPDLDKLFPIGQSPLDNLSEENKLSRELFDFLRTEHLMMYDIIGQIDSSALPFGKHICYIAMTRLSESYRACMMLIRMGFYFESYSIIRMIFEQLCWTLANYTLTDDDNLEKLIQPTKSISYAKSKFKNIGVFYYSLSHMAHISNNTIGLYLSQNEDDFTLTYSKPEYVFETQIALYSLIKMQIETLKQIYESEIKDYRFYAFDQGTDILEIDKRFHIFEDRLKKYELRINNVN